MAITYNEPGVTMNDARYAMNGAFIGGVPVVGLGLPYASSPTAAGVSSGATAVATASAVALVAPSSAPSVSTNTNSPEVR